MWIQFMSRDLYSEKFKLAIRITKKNFVIKIEACQDYYFFILGQLIRITLWV